MNLQNSSETIQLVVFDIDGTLLDSNQQLQPETRMVLRRCRQQHINYTLATGKNWDSVEELAEEIEINIPIILSNGAYLRDISGDFIEKTYIAESAMRRIIQICEQTGRDLSIYIDEDVYVAKKNSNTQFMEHFGSINIIETPGWAAISDRLARVHKCMVLDRQSPQNLAALEKDVHREMGDLLETCQAMPEILDLMAKGVSKGNALRRICSILGISPESAVAFGDGDNDIPFFSAAGLAVSLGNGSNMAKARADLIVPSNDRGGPARLLNYFLDR